MHKEVTPVSFPFKLNGKAIKIYLPILKKFNSKYKGKGTLKHISFSIIFKLLLHINMFIHITLEKIDRNILSEKRTQNIYKNFKNAENYRIKM